MSDSSGNKYVREIHDKNERRSIFADVYEIFEAWNVTSGPIQHAIKKLLMPGQRGDKGKIQDLEEAIVAIRRAIQIESRKDNTSEIPNP
jgi:hypothetical protein